MILSIDLTNPYFSIHCENTKLPKYENFYLSKKKNNTVSDLVYGISQVLGQHSYSEISHIAIISKYGSFMGIRLGKLIAQYFTSLYGTKIIYINPFDLLQTHHQALKMDSSVEYVYIIPANKYKIYVANCENQINLIPISSLHIQKDVIYVIQKNELYMDYIRLSFQDNYYIDGLLELSYDASHITSFVNNVL